MSSLIGTSNQEDVPVSGVQTISGLNINITSLPSRSCNGFSFVDLAKGKPDATRSQTPRQQQGMPAPGVLRATATASTSTASSTTAIGGDEEVQSKNEEGLQEFLSMLAGEKVTGAATDTATTTAAATTVPTAIDHTLTLVKARQTLPSPLPPTKQRQQHGHRPNIPPSEPSLSSESPTTPPIPAPAPGNISFDFTFGNSNSKNLLSSNQSLPSSSSADDKSTPSSNFQFSFSPPPSLDLSSPATTRGGMGYQRRVSNGRSLQQRQQIRRRDTQGMHPLSQTTTYFEDVDQDDYESDSDQPPSLPRQEPLLPARRPDMIPTSDISKYPHLQHRKILPLPKPRWKQRGLPKPPPAPLPPPITLSSVLQQSQQTFFGTPNSPNGSSNDLPLAPPSYVWQFSASSRDNADEDWGFGRLSLNDSGEGLFGVIAVDSGDSSYRDNAKKMKRSVGNETDIPVVMMTIGGEYDERKGVRQRDRKWKNGNSSSAIEERGSRATISVGGGSASRQFPEGSFDFSMDARTREKLKHLPKLEDLPRSQSTLGLSKVLRQTMPGIPLPATSRDSTGRAEPSPALPSNTNKKKNKVPEAIEATTRAAAEKPAVTASIPKRNNKKGQRKKKVDDEHGATNKALGSDIALIQSPDPDEWICIFCQYEIFCRGLEAARRKGGYYRRRKERQRRLKEVEARRAGELVTSDHEDDPTVDDMVPTSSVAAGPSPPHPPAGTTLSTGGVVDQRRGRGDRAA